MELSHIFGKHSLLFEAKLTSHMFLPVRQLMTLRQALKVPQWIR